MEKLFGLKNKLDELNKVFAPLAQKDKQVIKDPKVRYSENEVQNLKTQLQEIIGEVRAIGEEIKRAIQELPDEQNIFYKSGEEVQTISTRQLTVSQVSKIFRQFEDFDTFSKYQEKIAPEQTAKEKKSKIRQAFEDYFFYVDDVLTFVSEEARNIRDIDGDKLSVFTNYFTQVKRRMKNLVVANSDEEVRDKIRVFDDRDGKIEPYLRKQVESFKTPISKESEKIRQLILEKYPLPESLKVLFPNEFPPAAQPADEPADEKPLDIEEQASEKLEKEKSLYDAFKSYVKNQNDKVPEDLLSENEEPKSIKALMDGLDQARAEFKANPSQDNASAYIRLYDELKSKLQVSFATPEEGKEPKEFDKPLEFATFLSNYYDYSDIRKEAGIEELNIKTYQFILYLFIQYGISKEVNENKFKVLPGFDLRNYKQFKASAKVPWETTGSSFEEDEKDFLNLPRASILKILRAINKRYKSFPFKYTGEITDKMFINNYFRKTSAEPEGEQEKETPDKPEKDNIDRFREDVIAALDQSGDFNNIEKYMELMKKAIDNSKKVEDKVADVFESVVKELNGKILTKNNETEVDEKINKFLSNLPEMETEIKANFKKYVMIDMRDQNFDEVTNIGLFADMMYGNKKLYGSRSTNGKRLADFINKNKDSFTYGELASEVVEAQFDPKDKKITLLYQREDADEEEEQFFLSGKYSPNSIDRFMKKVEFKKSSIYRYRKGFIKKLKQAFTKPPVNERLKQKLKPIIKEVMKESYG